MSLQNDYTQGKALVNVYSILEMHKAHRITGEYFLHKIFKGEIRRAITIKSGSNTDIINQNLVDIYDYGQRNKRIFLDSNITIKYTSTAVLLYNR